MIICGYSYGVCGLWEDYFIGCFLVDIFGGVGGWRYYVVFGSICCGYVIGFFFYVF